MARLSIDALRREVRGHWGHVLSSIGVPETYLVKRNGPCPACGGKDRFSFTDKDGSGSFVCRAHHRQGGDGFELVRHLLGCDLPEALKAVSEAVGHDVARANRVRLVKPTAPKPTTDRGISLQRLWHESEPVATGDPVALYLQRRGINLTTYPLALRTHKDLPYWHEVHNHPRKLASYPAMIAAVQSPDGLAVALHRTYLTQEGDKAAPICPESGVILPVRKLMTRAEGVLPGAAIRLGNPTTKLAIAEGVETALAVQLLSGAPTWSCVSAFGVETVEIPEQVTEVFIAADNDVSGTGQKAAQKLAERLTAQGRTATVIYPTSEGCDWLDVLTMAD